MSTKTKSAPSDAAAAAGPVNRLFPDAAGDGASAAAPAQAMPRARPSKSKSKSKSRSKAQAAAAAAARPATKVLNLIVVRREGGVLDVEGDGQADRELLRQLCRTTEPVHWPELVARAGYHGLDIFLAASRPALP